MRSSDFVVAKGPVNSHNVETSLKWSKRKNTPPHGRCWWYLAYFLSTYPRSYDTKVSTSWLSTSSVFGDLAALCYVARVACHYLFIFWGSLAFLFFLLGNTHLSASVHYMLLCCVLHYVLSHPLSLRLARHLFYTDVYRTPASMRLGSCLANPMDIKASFLLVLFLALFLPKSAVSD